MTVPQSVRDEILARVIAIKHTDSPGVWLDRQWFYQLVERHGEELSGIKTRRQRNQTEKFRQRTGTEFSEAYQEAEEIVESVPDPYLLVAY